ncbi:hypothetical protein AUP42_10005 [Thalassospira lucentensis]|uniref:SGNH hydrolase-type esterase domain-containing protein n=2 Tax=Thalassospira TaxID=168934 RepID=A0A285TG79_9PROT|nr:MULTISPECIES: hypothetical protein [Thalassospira]KZB69202.1 hypothetical protein AUP42_10005 [Thalassospira lucentensis]MCH2273965.1 hypothetical protein [Thalassospira sp.]SOC21093.1 hypothetical protein SAMN05428964_103302 [Thalassospira xiamenensis]
MTNKKTFAGRFLSGAALVLCGLILACGAGEGLVRLATADQKNYLVEMWRYATLLKQKSDDPAVGHEHIPGTSARLQGVEVSINSLGMRGPEVDLATRGKNRVVIIGDSVAMGWGVPEEDTLRGQLADRLGPNAEVMTTGVGNMNMSQIVAHWLHYSPKIDPQTVVMLATARAPIIQKSDHAGWLVRHSQLYALIVSFIEMAASNSTGEQELVDSYRAVWTEGPGMAAMDAAMDRLKLDQERRGYRVVILLVPEPHSFDPYRFDFINQVMAAKAKERDWIFIDPVPVMKSAPAEKYWVASNDVHANAKAFEIFTDLLVPELTIPKD